MKPTRDADTYASSVGADELELTRVHDEKQDKLTIGKTAFSPTTAKGDCLISSTPSSSLERRTKTTKETSDPELLRKRDHSSPEHLDEVWSFEGSACQHGEDLTAILRHPPERTANDPSRKRNQHLPTEVSEYLYRYFVKNPRPPDDHVAVLAKNCGLGTQKIRVWFKNRRSRRNVTLRAATVMKKARTVHDIVQRAVSRNDGSQHGFGTSQSEFSAEVESSPDIPTEAALSTTDGGSKSVCHSSETATKVSSFTYKEFAGEKCPRCHKFISQLKTFHEHVECFNHVCSFCPMCFSSENRLTAHMYQFHPPLAVLRTYLSGLLSNAFETPTLDTALQEVELPNNWGEAAANGQRIRSTMDLPQTIRSVTDFIVICPEPKCHCILPTSPRKGVGPLKIHLCEAHEKPWLHVRSVATSSPKHQSANSCAGRQKLSMARMGHWKPRRERGFFRCDFPNCGQKFISQRQLYDHHRRVGHPLLPCPFSRCSDVFSFVSSVKAHVLDVHIKGTHKRQQRLSNSKECEICHERVDRNALTRHMRDVHNQLIRHDCHHCDKSFSYYVNLLRHVKSTHFCQVCRAKYRNLQEHYKEQHGGLVPNGAKSKPSEKVSPSVFVDCLQVDLLGRTSSENPLHQEEGSREPSGDALHSCTRKRQAEVLPRRKKTKP